jgi:hypothetical protein
MSSQYSDISKEIGWSGTATIPSIEEANELRNKVKQNDREAFKQSFIIHRFASSPTHPDHEKAMRIVYDAWCIGMKHFQMQSGEKQVSFDI